MNEYDTNAMLTVITVLGAVIARLERLADVENERANLLQDDNEELRAKLEQAHEVNRANAMTPAAEWDEVQALMEQAGVTEVRNLGKHDWLVVSQDDNARAVTLAVAVARLLLQRAEDA